MILQTEKFRDACSIILGAIDTKESSLFTETLELRAQGSNLKLNVTNREYFVSINFILDKPEQVDFIAAVNAKLFLSLISKITSPTIEITIDGNAIKVKGNGVYKLPMTYNMGKLLELPEINISNITDTMFINNSILQSILTYNSKELLRGEPVKPVQKYYYVDETGCITFTSGACVNTFSLAKPIKMLLSDKVVKLFKLFKDETTNVSFEMGIDQVTPEITQTKVRFIADNVTLTAKLSDSSLVSSVPVAAIRGMATQTCAHSVQVNRDALVSALNRLILFSDNDDSKGTLVFSEDHIDITDESGENKETVKLETSVPGLSYTAKLKMKDLNLVVSGCEEEAISISFGDKKAFVFKKQSIADILPER